MTEKDALPLLADLVKALTNANISSWQSTAAWDKELAAAQQYLAEMEQKTSETRDNRHQSRFLIFNQTTGAKA